MQRLRGYLPTLAFLAATGLAIFLNATSRPSLEDRLPIGIVVGSVAEIDRGSDEIRLQLSLGTRIQHIASADDAVYEALRGSVRTGKSVTLRLTPEGAHFIDDSDVSVHWVESLEYEGKKFGPFEAGRRWSWRDLPQSDAALLRAIAMSDALRDREAVAQFDRALASGLNGRRAGRAFFGRGMALETLAYPAGRALNEQDDRLLVRAVSDLRRAAQLRPNDNRTLMRQARCLQKLGAFPEALSLYEEVERRWPRERTLTVVARSATLRQMGRDDDALRALDVLADGRGGVDGMTYHYHRARTLNKLMRSEEAEREISAGLETQPDHAWAFVERACARARLGRLEDARTDLRTAQRFWEKALGERTPAERAEHIRAVFKTASASLDTALSRSPRAKSDAPCAAPFGIARDAARERSAFLPRELPIS